MKPGPNVCIGIEPMCVSVENQRGIGIEVTEVNKEEENLKRRKSAQGFLDQRESHFLHKSQKRG